MLVLGYLALGSIIMYRMVFMLGDIFYDTDQTAVGAVHMITLLSSAVWASPANNGRENGEEYSASCSVVSQHVR